MDISPILRKHLDQVRNDESIQQPKYHWLGCLGITFFVKCPHDGSRLHCEKYVDIAVDYYHYVCTRCGYEQVHIEPTD